MLLLARYPHLRAMGLLTLAVFLYYLAMNAVYYYWDGGFSLGPRHFTPCPPIPAAGCGGGCGWGRVGVGLTATATAIGGCVIIMAMGTANMLVDNAILRPITELVIPAFLEGRIITGPSRVFGSGGVASFLLYLAIAL